MLILGLTLGLSVSGLLTVSGPLAATSAQAATSTTLPITSFYQIVADTAHGHLFISQGTKSAGSQILVTNLAGQQVATIDGQDGVTGIALSPDGKTLYAADAFSHAVTAIDTATLQQAASYPLGDGNTPADVAVQSGKVWVSYDTGTVGESAIGDIDLSATSPAFQTQAAMGGWYAAPQLAADPQDTGVLVAVEPGMSPASVASYNVATDPATVTAPSTSLQNCDNEQDVAVAPGGAQFVLACGAPYDHYRYRTADLSVAGFYPTSPYPNAVAIDADGTVAAGTQNDPSDPDLYVFNSDAGTPLNTFSLNSSGDDLMPRGLAWAADGSQVFAVLQDSAGTGYGLQVISEPAFTQSALSLTGPSTASLARSVKLTGKLTFSTGTPAAGTPISAVRSIPGGTSKTFSLSTAANGSYSLTDTPPGPGRYTYTASYGGSTTVAPATTSFAVNVTRIPTSLSVTTKSATFTYKPTVPVTAHLGKTHTNRTVSIYAQPFGRTTRTLVKTGRVNSSGNVTVRYAAAHSTTFSAVFSGDADYAARTVTRVIYVRARVSESLTGQYRRTRVHGRTYWLFHRHGTLRAHAIVAPDKSGQCVTFDVQEYYRGTWHPSAASGCVHLSRASKASAAFGLTRADVGFRYRIRVDYTRSSKDTTNRNNVSAWRYLIIER